MNLREVFERMESDKAINTLRAILNTYSYWRKCGYPETHSMENAMKYAKGQLRSVVHPDNLGDSIRNFRLIARVGNRIVELLDEEIYAKPVHSKVAR